MSRILVSNSFPTNRLLFFDELRFEGRQGCNGETGGELEGDSKPTSHYGHFSTGVTA